MTIRWDINDADMRLRGSIIRYGEDVVVVQGFFDSPNRVLLFNPLTGKEIITSFDDERINVKAFSPGYVNMNESCYFITRANARQYRQGMTPENINTRYPLHRSNYAAACIALSLKGKFPSVSSAFTWISRGQRKDVALSRTTALKLKGRLKLPRVYFNEEEVGKIGDDGIEINEGFERIQPFILRGLRYE